jgi:protease I
MKVLILTADGFEDLELFCPFYRLREEGAAVVVATPSGARAEGRHGYVAAADLPIGEANPAEYDLLLLPGGEAPERLRLRDEAVDLVRTFIEADRPVAALGRGPQLLISAGVLAGRQVTCAPSIRDDVRAAGGNYRNLPLATDGNLITARGVDDLPPFCRQLVSALAVQM